MKSTFRKLFCKGSPLDNPFKDYSVLNSTVSGYLQQANYNYDGVSASFVDVFGGIFMIISIIL